MAKSTSLTAVNIRKNTIGSDKYNTILYNKNKILCYSRKHRTGGSGVIHTEVNVARNTGHNAVNVLPHNRIKRIFKSLPAFLRPSVWARSHTG